MGKKIMLGVMGLGAAAAAAMFFLGIPPVGDGTAGTIGAAKRFQGAALSDKDVVVGPMEVQQFLQSDTFDRIMKNDAARNMLIRASQDLELQRTLGDPALMRAFASVELQQALSNAEFQQALTDVEFQQALGRFRFADVELQQAVMSLEFQQALRMPGLMAALAEPAFQQALRVPNFMAALAEPAFQQALVRRR